MKRISLILAMISGLLSVSLKSNAYNQTGSAFATGHTLYCVGSTVTCFTDLRSGGSFVSGGYYYIFLETGIVYAQIYATARSTGPGETHEFEFIPRGLEEDISFYSISDEDQPESLALNEVPTEQVNN